MTDRRTSHDGSSPPGPADLPGGELGFPLLGRLLVAITLVASGLAALALVRSWSAYRMPLLVVAAWVVTVVSVPLAVRRTLADGRMRAVSALAFSAMVLAVDLVVPLTLDPTLRTTLAAWNWRSCAVLLLVLSAYRPPRDVVLLAGAHAAAASAWGVHAGAASSSALVVLVVTCAAPSLIASNYLALYTEGLRSRRTAVDLYTRTSAMRAAEQAERQSVLDEVASIRSQIVTLLESVSDGRRRPSDADVRLQARELSAALRRELDESRSRGWLITGGGPVGGPVVDVLGPAALLDDDARACVAALVELLRRHADLRQIVVTVSPGSGPVGRAAGAAAAAGDARDDEGADVIVVASGGASAAAAADPAIVAAADGLNATVWHDAEADHLVVEGWVR